MSVLNKNEFFYTALQIAVAQDKNPDWIFKTNLLHIDNIAQEIRSDNLIRPEIDLTSIYYYLDNETPFHVHFDNFAIQYTKNDEVATAQVLDEHVFNIELGFHNVSEYPTTIGYDKLPYDFEYPGIGTNGSDYIDYNPDFGFEQEQLYPDSEEVNNQNEAGWYPFATPPAGSKYEERTMCQRGTLVEDPICGLYDYQPNTTEFNNVLKAYNAHNNTNISARELITEYYKDPYYFDNTTNYVYILHQNQTFEWVKKQAHNEFKGLIVQGGKNDSDKNGYDSSEYDYELYDYITYENKYYLSDGQAEDWFLEEETKYNKNKIVPLNTEKFYVPEAPFATKKINVYLNEKSKMDNFNLFGGAIIENNWLKSYNNQVSYGSLKRTFNVGNLPWEIQVVLNLKEDLPVIYGRDSRFVNKLIQIVGSSSQKYSLPQLYFVKDTIYLDISTNGRQYNITMSKGNITDNRIYDIKIGYDRTKYYMIIDGEEISVPSTFPIYSEGVSSLHLGDSNYDKELINYVPLHYIGGIFQYRTGLPYYDAERNIVYVPSLSVIYPISRNELQVGSVQTVSDLPSPENSYDGEIYYVENEDSQYIFYDTSWTPYNDAEEYVQQMGILDVAGNQQIVSFYSARQASSSFEFQYIIANTSTNSNVSIPNNLDNSHPGLLIYRLGQVSIEVADYLGKFDRRPTNIERYPVYYFDIITDSFFRKDSASSDWVEETKFALLSKVSKTIYNNIILNVFPTFNETNDVRYLYQDSDMNLNLFKLTVNGIEASTDVEKDSFLHLNRDYEIKLEPETNKEYIRLLDSNGDTKNLNEGSIVRIDCLDYDYLYDVMFVNKDNAEHQFTRYKSFLGYFASVEDLVSRSGSIKVKYHDYFYNTTTNTEWILESPTNWELFLALENPDIEILLDMDNYNHDIYEVLGFEFYWMDTGNPFGTIVEQDLALLKGTTLQRPYNTAKGSEELRTGVRDGLIIDIIEDASLIEIDNLKLSPRVISEYVPEGKNREIKLNVLNNDSVLKFVNGKYQDISLKWKSKTGLKPLPNELLHALTDITSDDTKLLEIEKDTLDIIFSKLLYGQTEREFNIEFDSFNEGNEILVTFDGNMLTKDIDYTYEVDSTNELLYHFEIINDSLYIPASAKHCYGVYLAKGGKSSVVYKRDVPSLPFTIDMPSQVSNISILNNFMLFDTSGKKIPSPYMKWYYLTEDTSEIVLPITSIEGLEATDINVYIGAGHDLTKLLQVQASQYSIDGNVLRFVRPIPKDLTIGVVIATDDSYNVSFIFDNGRYIVDYDLNYIVDYLENYIVDYGSEEGSSESEVTIIITSERDLQPKTLVYVANATKFNFRLDTYQKTENNVYHIHSNKFDRKSLNVWRNGILLKDNEYIVQGNTIRIFTSYNLETDIIQVWYKVNKSVISYEHNKIIISDTNEIYNLKNLPVVNTYLMYPFKYDDVKMYVDNANYLTQPDINPQDVSQSKPGRIQIGNEIIEFWSINYNDTVPRTDIKCHSLSGFVKDIKGSSVHLGKYYPTGQVDDQGNPIYEYREDLEYPIGTGIQDIGNRYETLNYNAKNKESRIDHMIVEQNWLDFPERTYINEYGETSYVHSIMPWYNIPGTVNQDEDVSVWKNEEIKIVADYNPETDTVLSIENDKNLDKITSLIYRSKVGNYTYDCNGMVEYDNMFYRSGFVSDKINIELFNEEENLLFQEIPISGSIQDAANIINNAVDTNILYCRAINDELEEQSYMQFILKNGYSMRIVEDDADQSFFIQELFGGIQKSTKGDITQVELIVNEDNGMAIITPDGSRYEYRLKQPSGGLSTIDWLVSDVNNDFDEHRVWLTVKPNPQINNINQLNIVNYNTEPVHLEELGFMSNNFNAMGIDTFVDGCPVLTDNANGELVVRNENKGRIILNEHSYYFNSIIYEEDKVNLVGIHIPYEIHANDTFIGTKLIKQELGTDFYVEFNAVKFYKRLPLGTLIRIQNKNIVVNSNVDYLHSHLES